MSRLAEVAGASALLERCQREAEFVRRYDATRCQVLGEGSFACVARLHDRDLAQDVAVKMFWRVTPELRARIRAEVANAQRIHADTVVQTHSVSLGQDSAWLQMELVDGPNLEQELLRRAKSSDAFGMSEALRCARDAADALAQAHAVGVAHRDVKPSNYLLPADRRPLLKLGDFGISKHRDAANLTGTGEFPGTPAYAAVEVFDGRTAGAASDVYSLGLVLFRILSGGHNAYDLSSRPTPLEFMAAHRGSRPRRLRDFMPSLPRTVEEIVWDALAKDPGMRPEAALVREVLDESCRCVSGASAVPSPRRRVRRHVSLASLGGVVVVGIGLAGTLRSELLRTPTAPVPLPAAYAAASAPLVHEDEGVEVLDPAAPPSARPAVTTLRTGSLVTLAPDLPHPARSTAAPAPSRTSEASSPPSPVPLATSREAVARTAASPHDQPLATAVASTDQAAPDEPPTAPTERELRVFPTTVVRGTRGAPDGLLARIELDVIPNRVLPGEPYVVEVRLANDGRQALRIADLALVDTRNGERRGAPALPLARQVKAGEQILVNRVAGRWPADLESWTLEVFVTADHGDTLKGLVTWR
jgi:eukaryotic-like serine/threonine-protein kinase